jgi:excisionase family DNA binding protein
MSSNIKIQRVCQYCRNEFIARMTTTRYCGHTCNSRAYKAKERGQKIEASNTETLGIKLKPIEILKAKEFLSVREAAKLLNCSLRTTYRLIDNGTIKALNLSERKTTIRRVDIDNLFSQIQNIA